MTATPSYFDQRMAQIGITAANNSYTYTDEKGVVWTRKFFEPDQQGNIIIHYHGPDGHIYSSLNGKDKHAKNYTRTRIMDPQPDEEGKVRKYKSPSGMPNFPYFCAPLIDDYLKANEVGTLIITEGEFKAVAGCMAGLKVIGTSGIHNWYDPNGTKRMHDDIIRFIERCKVKRLVFLTDADTLLLNFKPEKEMNERPNMFYSAVKNFREAAVNHYMARQQTTLTDVYFAHVDVQYATTHKGLDDLLHGLAIQAEKIVAALLDLTHGGNYFKVMQITDGLNRLKKYFGLDSPENFHTVYQQYLTTQEFKFNRLTYRYDEEEKKLIRIRHQDVYSFMRIGCDWFKNVKVPNKYAELEDQIKKWKVAEIVRDYGKRYPTFLEDIPKYEDWCNIPAMHGTYERVHNGCYNLFNPIIHTPTEGSIENTLAFIKHLFAGEATAAHNITGDPFTVALDYLTLMWQNPVQILPVLCLVSPENNTGKSTFLKWLRDIYGSNATIIDNERFKQKFNSHYITKYIIGIDEGFLDVEKRSEKERLKKLATDDRQYLEFKGADVVEIDFYSKIIICSNDADNLMKIEDGEIRWFVVRVQPFTSEDPHFRAKLKAEIPAWIHFLSHRQVHHPFEGRAWFHPDHIRTEQLRIIIEKTRNRAERVIDDFIRTTFLTYKVNRIIIDARGIAEAIFDQGLSKYRIDVQEIRAYLCDKKKLQLSQPQRISIPTGYTDGGLPVMDYSRTARCWTLRAQDWVKEEDTSKYSENGLSLDETHSIFPENAPTEIDDLQTENTPF